MGWCSAFKKLKTRKRLEFLAFRQSRNIPRVWNRVTEHGRNISYFLAKDSYLDFRSACSKPYINNGKKFSQKAFVCFYWVFYAFSWLSLANANNLEIKQTSKHLIWSLVQMFLPLCAGTVLVHQCAKFNCFCCISTSMQDYTTRQVRQSVKESSNDSDHLPHMHGQLLIWRKMFWSFNFRRRTILKTVPGLIYNGSF